MWPLRFVMPHDPSMRPVWMVRAGLFLYDHLAKREWLPASGTVALRSHPTGAPLKPGYTRGFVYSDGWVDDARLVVLNALDAQAHGAAVHTRCRVRSGPAHTPGLAGHAASPKAAQRLQVQARALVNAAGPWTGEFLRQRAGQTSARALRLVKGSHIVVKKLFEPRPCLHLPEPRQAHHLRHPLRGRFHADRHHRRGDPAVHPAAARIDADETAYLCAQASRYFAKPVAPGRRGLDLLRRAAACWTMHRATPRP